MTHHWRASDQLEPSLRPGEWRLYDRGYLVGVIQWGRAGGKPVLRGLAPDGSPLGYAATLEDACDTMWEWYRRVGRGHAGTPAARAQPDASVQDWQS